MLKSPKQILIPAIAGDRINKAVQGRSLGIIYTFGDMGSMLGPPIALSLINSGRFTIQSIYQYSSFLLFGIAVFSLLQMIRKPFSCQKG